jgi:arsenate reductase (thioredoxin)
VTASTSVLFSCVHNSGRSVAAAALMRHYAGELVDVRSAGSDPRREVNPVVARVLAERGLAVTDHTPTRLARELVEAADVVVTLGCGESCPYVSGKRYEDWEVMDPMGQDVDTVRRIVDDLDARVRRLLDDLVAARS